MTPEQIGALVDRYGLPLIILGGLLYLVLKEKLVTGARLQAMVALYERERTDRMAAELIVAKFAAANADVAEAVAELSRTVLTPPRRPPARKPEAYAERLAGTPKRDR